MNLLEALRRRRMTLLGTVTLVMSLVSVVYLFMRPVYRADARLVIEESQGMQGMLDQLSQLPMGLGSLMGGAQTATEIEFVRSRPVASSVVGHPGSNEIAPGEGLNLTVRVDDLDSQVRWRRYWRILNSMPEPQGTPGVAVNRWDFPVDFETPLRLHFTASDEVEIGLDRPFLKRSLLQRFRPGEAFDYLDATLTLRPDRDLTGRSFRLIFKSQQKAVDDFLKSLGVQETRRGSNVLRVSYPDYDPDRAAEVVNAVVRSYMVHNRVRQQRRASRSIEYVESEIDRVRDELEEAELALVAYAQEAGNVVLPETAKVLVEKLAEVDLEQAKSELLVHSTEELLLHIRSGEFSLDDIAGLEPQAFLSNDLVQPLSALLAQKAVFQEEYTEDWPEFEALEVEISERVAAIESVLSGVILKGRRYALDLDSILGRYLAEMEKLPDTQLNFVRHKRQVEAFTQIYLYLVGQAQAAKINESSAVPNVDLVEWAVSPLEPSSPRFLFILLLAAVLSTVVGAGLGLIRDLSVRPLGSESRAQTIFAVPALARLPFVRRLRPGPGALSEESVLREHFRLLRGSFRKLADAAQARTIAVVSAREGEGRTTVCAHLAASLARGGARVLLLDADMSHPVLHDWFKVPRAPGLSKNLTAAETWRDSIHDTDIDGFGFLSAGRAEADASDLLSRPKARQLFSDLRTAYDLVIVDTPALLGHSDGSEIAALVDGVLVVVAENQLAERDALEAAARLNRSGGRILGVLFNRSTRTC